MTRFYAGGGWADGVDADPMRESGVRMEQERSSDRMRLQLFGLWRLSVGAIPIHMGLRQQRLVAALAIRGPCRRRHLAGLLWPDAPECRAASNLRVGIHIATRQVQGLLVREDCDISLSEAVDVDLHRIRRLLAATAGTEELGSRATACLVELQTGDLLPGWYDDFVLSEQDRLLVDRLHCFRRIARESLEHGRAAVAIRAARAALALDPYDGFSVAQLIRAELMQCNRSSAVRIYHDHADVLDRDLGITPAPEITALIADLPAPSADRLGAGRVDHG